MAYMNNVVNRKRQFKPFILGLVMTMTIVAQSNFRNMDRGTQYPLSLVVAFMAGGAVAALVWGLVGNAHWALMAGLALTVAAYSTRAAFIHMNTPFDQSVFFSLANTIAASGAYILEARYHAPEKGG